MSNYHQDTDPDARADAADRFAATEKAASADLSAALRTTAEYPGELFDGLGDPEQGFTTLDLS